jgi:hypothetical protein
MVIGGQAVLQYGEPRLTKDIDITVGAGVDTLDVVVACMRKAGLASLVKNVQQFVCRTHVWPTEDPRSGIRVDIIFSETAYERQAMRRCRAIKVGRREVLFASPEDVIIHKIISGRPRDFEDVRGIFAGTRNLNMRYTRKWLAAFEGVLDKPLLPALASLKKDSRTTIRRKPYGKN